MRGLYGQGHHESRGRIVTPDASSNVHSGAKSREPFYYQGSIGIPVQDPTGQTGAVVLQFVVPSGKNGYLWKLAIDFVGAGFVEGSGTIVWKIFRDAALRKAVKGFNRLVASVASVPNPNEIPPIQIYENETITVVMYNIGAGAPAGQVSAAAIIGWFYQKSQEKGSRWG